MTDRKQTFWHPFADMSRVRRNEVVLVKGEGATVLDERGRRYIDATAALWYANVGHGRPELADAAATQMRELAAYSTFGAYANRPALDLCDRIAEIAPIDDCAVFLTTGGSEAVETAAKLTRRYWRAVGRPERTVFVTRSESYHGMSAFGTSLAGIAANADGWGTLVPGVVQVPHDDADALADILRDHGDQIAAFIGEPVIGAGGVIPPVDGYWRRVQELCGQYGILLIADEVVTGYGRLGEWFACRHYDIHPDLVTTAKGVSSGYAPLGAVIAGPRVRDALWSADAGVVRHGYTYSGHAAACAVALANLDIIEREDLLGNVRKLTPLLADGLEALTALASVEGVRHAGLLGSVTLSKAVLPTRPQAVEHLVERLQERGVLIRGLVGHSLQLSPPFVITPDQLDELFAALRDELALLPVGETRA